MGTEAPLAALFELMKRSNIAICGKKSEFNDTEIRLFSEIAAASAQGERLISTQLADLLGITRSAVSQIVNRLEERHMVKRVADAVDRKIAYIEMTDEAKLHYETMRGKLSVFTDTCVARLGEEKFRTMCALFEEFIGIVEEEKKAREEATK